MCVCVCLTHRVLLLYYASNNFSNHLHIMINSLLALRLNVKIFESWGAKKMGMKIIFFYTLFFLICWKMIWIIILQSWAWFIKSMFILISLWAGETFHISFHVLNTLYIIHINIIAAKWQYAY